MEYQAIVLAAGDSTRSGLGYNKVLFEVNGIPIIYLSTKNFILDNNSIKLLTFKSWVKGLFGSGTGTTYSSTNGTFSVDYGTEKNTACEGNDSRLSNKREPTAHASTGTTYGVSSATQYGHAMATTTTPKANGVTGSLGNETAKFARGDHVHPESYSVPRQIQATCVPTARQPTDNPWPMVYAASPTCPATAGTSMPWWYGPMDKRPTGNKGYQVNITSVNCQHGSVINLRLHRVADS